MKVGLDIFRNERYNGSYFSFIIFDGFLRVKNIIKNMKKSFNHKPFISSLFIKRLDLKLKKQTFNNIP